MDLAVLSGPETASQDIILLSTGAALAERMMKAANNETGLLNGFYAPGDEMVVAVHNADGVLYFETALGNFYELTDEGKAAFLGNGDLNGLFKKIGNAISSAAKTVGNTVKTVATTTAQAVGSAAKVVTRVVATPFAIAQDVIKGESLKDAIKTAGDRIGNSAKEFADKAGNLIRLVAKVFPVTVLLRNGFLVLMKLNAFGFAEQIKYAYLTPAQAEAYGIEPEKYAKLVRVKDDLETAYWQAGGKRENLKHAIINGKGNDEKNNRIDFNLPAPTEFQDAAEYEAITGNKAPADATVNGLGELGIAETAAAASATGAVLGFWEKIKSIGNIFKKGSKLADKAQKVQDKITKLETKKADIERAISLQAGTVKSLKDLIPVGDTSDPNVQSYSDPTTGQTYTVDLNTNRVAQSAADFTTPPAKEKSNTLLYVGLGVFGVAAVGGGIYAATRNNQSKPTKNTSLEGPTKPSSDVYKSKKSARKKALKKNQVKVITI